MNITAENENEAKEKAINLLEQAKQKKEELISKYDLDDVDVVPVNGKKGVAFAYLKEFNMTAFSLTVQFQAEPIKALEMIFKLLVLEESDKLIFTDSYKMQVLLWISENSVKKNANLITF